MGGAGRLAFARVAHHESSLGRASREGCLASARVTRVRTSLGGCVSEWASCLSKGSPAGQG
eukprot:4982123-Pyramimonas_sp.AAC.1